MLKAKDVCSLHFRPGDILVIKSEASLPAEQLNQLGELLRKNYPGSIVIEGVSNLEDIMKLDPDQMKEYGWVRIEDAF